MYPDAVYEIFSTGAVVCQTVLGCMPASVAIHLLTYVTMPWLITSLPACRAGMTCDFSC